MLTQQFTFPSADGKTSIHAVKWSPDDGKYRAILQITHGMIEFTDRYRPFAGYLTDRGFLVVGMDLLGHGASVLSEDQWGYFAEGDPSGVICRDIHRLREITEKENPGVPYFMLGHSMGSYLLRKYLGLHGGGLAGAIIMGTGYNPPAVTRLAICITKILSAVHGSHYRSHFIEGLTQGKPYRGFDTTGKNPESSWLTKDTEIVKAYYNDPRCKFLFTLNGYLGLFQAVLYACGEAGIKAVPESLPLLFVSGEDDPVGSLGEGVRKVVSLFQATGHTNISCTLYPNDRHEILNETDRDKVFRDIYAWLERQLEGSALNLTE